MVHAGDPQATAASETFARTGGPIVKLDLKRGADQSLGHPHLPIGCWILVPAQIRLQDVTTGHGRTKAQSAIRLPVWQQDLGC